MSTEKSKHESKQEDKSQVTVEGIYKKTEEYVQKFLDKENNKATESDVNEIYNEWWNLVHEKAKSQDLIQVVSLIDTRDKKDGKSRLMKGKREAMLAEINYKNAKILGKAVNQLEENIKKSSNTSLRVSRINLLITSIWFIFTIIITFVINPDKLSKIKPINTILNQKKNIEKVN